jgi:hypothetical protein
MIDFSLGNILLRTTCSSVHSVASFFVLPCLCIASCFAPLTINAFLPYFLSIYYSQPGVNSASNSCGLSSYSVFLRHIILYGWSHSTGIILSALNEHIMETLNSMRNIQIQIGMGECLPAFQSGVSNPCIREYL